MAQQTCQLHGTAETSEAWQINTSDVSHSRHVCCVTWQTCLLCDRTVAGATEGEGLPDAKQWFCVTGGGGRPPSHLRHKTLVQYIQDLHYANPCLVLCRWRGSMPTPLLRRKTVVLCHKQSSGPKLIFYCGSNHVSWISTPALRQKLSIEQT